MVLGHFESEEFLIRRIELVTHLLYKKALTNNSISPQGLSSMLVRPMIYRHPNHCLSWNIPHLGSQGVFHQDYSYLGLPSLQRILVLYDYSYLIFPNSSSKSIKCQMFTQPSILSSQVKTRMMFLSLPLN